MKTNPETWRTGIITFCTTYALLAASMVGAGQVRVTLLFGRPLGPDYQPHFFSLYALLLVGTGSGFGLALLRDRLNFTFSWLMIARPFRLLLTCAILSSGLVLVLLPDVSQLRLIYFMAMVILLGVLVVVLPGRVRAAVYAPPQFISELVRLYEARYLYVLWLNYRVRSRYSQTLLGIVWIVLVPLSQALMFAFVFGTLFGIRTPDAPYVPFFLSGMILFQIFQSTVLKSSNGFSGQMRLMQQVYFPRELTLLLFWGEALVDFCFTFLAMVIINVVFGLYPNWHYLWLPVPLLLMSCIALGLGLIFSWVSLVIRDLQQLLGVVVQLLFYLTVLFAGKRVPAKYQVIEQLNPLSSIVEAFRQIVLYNAAPEFEKLLFPAALAVGLLYFGYVFFKANEERILDYT